MFFNQKTAYEMRISDWSSDVFSSDLLDGMLAATLEARFVYGSVGTTAIVMVQTTLDQENWLDVARFDFAQANAVKIANLSGLTAKAVAAYAALGAEGVNDGLFGSRWRAILTRTGPYGGNTSVAPTLKARRP